MRERETEFYTEAILQCVHDRETAKQCGTAYKNVYRQYAIRCLQSRSAISRNAGFAFRQLPTLNLYRRMAATCTVQKWPVNADPTLEKKLAKIEFLTIVQ